MDPYKALIEREKQKLDVLRETRTRLDHQIAESEQFINVLTKRTSQGGDELDALVERKMASKSAEAAQSTPATHVAPTTVVAAATTATDAASGIADYKFPKIRSDSAWPYILVIMSARPGAWKAAEIVKAVLDANVLRTDSAVRSTLSTMAMKDWELLNNDTPGYFSPTDKALAFVATLKPNQFVRRSTPA